MAALTQPGQPTERAVCALPCRLAPRWTPIHARPSLLARCNLPPSLQDGLSKSDDGGTTSEEELADAEVVVQVRAGGRLARGAGVLLQEQEQPLPRSKQGGAGGCGLWGQCGTDNRVERVVACVPPDASHRHHSLGAMQLVLLHLALPGSCCCRG